jgi:hypothetical protein
MTEVVLQVGDVFEVAGTPVRVAAIGQKISGNSRPVATVTVVFETSETPTVQADANVGKFDLLGLSKRITNLLNDAEGDQFDSPESLRDWLVAGGDISDAVPGLGEKSEAQILAALGVET